MKQQAVAILKKAQSLLTERLCEYVIENQESFLEAASGADLGLHNEIYDAADKLRDISIILSVLPDSPEPSPTQVQVVESEGGSVVQTPPALTFGSFVAAVEDGNFETATVVLAHLFQLSVARAGDCVRFFANKWATDPDVYFKAITVPSAVRTPSDESLKLLHELFGLQGVEIAHVFRASQSTF